MKRDVLSQQLRSLADRPGPFVTLAIDTRLGGDLRPDDIEARWRALRSQVEQGEVPEKALLQLDDLVDGSHRAGDGMIAITSGEEVVFTRFFASAAPDTISAGPLPHLLPLIDHMTHHPSYGIVLIDRTSAEIHVVDDMRDDRVIEVEGDHDVIRKVHPGGMSQRRFQQRAEDSWERNSEQIEEELRKIVQSEGLELVLVMGDVRAKALLAEAAAPEIQPLLHQLDTAPSTSGALEEVREDLEAAVAALVAHQIDSTLERFQEERGQSDLAADGIEATFEALRMAQVETLLINSRGIGSEAWFVRNDPTQGAARRETLAEIGLEADAERGRTDDVLIRMASATGASVCVVPDLGPDRGPSEGVGATLRFSTRASSRDGGV